MKQLQKAVLGYFPLFFIAAAIFTFSSLSFLPMPDVQNALGDKLIHGVVFLCFGVCAAFATWNREPLTRKRIFAEAFIVTCIYGLLDEYHQFFVPFRDASLGDFFADAVGGLFGVTLFICVARKKESQRPGGG